MEVKGRKCVKIRRVRYLKRSNNIKIEACLLAIARSPVTSERGVSAKPRNEWSGGQMMPDLSELRKE